jgi:hypothetical protein
MSLLTATPASLREALRAGADRFAGYRGYKYFAPTEPDRSVPSGSRFNC